MSYSPSPIQALLLWKIAIAGGEVWKADLAPKYFGEKRVRGDLLKHGYISEEMLLRVSSEKRSAKSLKLTLEDEGWGWLAANLHAPLAKSAAAADVLQGVLKLLQSHLNANKLVLSDLFAHQLQDSVVNDQVLLACGTLARDSASGRVRIASLKKELNSVDLTELHSVLLTSQEAGRLTLFPIDNPRELTDEDKCCELTTSLGQKRHIVYLQENCHE